MYPTGTYKGGLKGLGDMIPFLDPTLTVDVAQSVNSYNPAATALAAQGLVQNYDAQGNASPSRSTVAASQTPTKVTLSNWALQNQGLLAMAVIGVLALAALRK